MLALTVAPSAQAGTITLQGGGKNRDVRFMIVVKFFGIPVSTLVDEQLTAGTTKDYTVQTNFLSGLYAVTTVEQFVNASGQPLSSTNNYESVFPDPSNPGRFIQPSVEAVLATTGGQRIPLPDLASDVSSLFVTTDLGQWLAAGSPILPVGSSFSIVNGTSPLLPGVLVGLSDITFDPTSGFVNSAPFSGNAFVLGQPSITAVPEPVTFSLIALALAGGLAQQKRICSRRRTL